MSNVEEICNVTLGKKVMTCDEKAKQQKTKTKQKTMVHFTWIND